MAAGATSPAPVTTAVFGCVTLAAGLYVLSRRDFSMRRILVTLLLAALAAVSGCHRREAEHARVDAALAPLLPSDTTGVACLRLDKLKGTPFWNRYVAGRRIPALEEFSRSTGLDPRDSIWELVLATNGRRALLLVRGKFGGEFGFEPEARTAAIRRASYKGRYLLSTGDAGVVFMNTGAAVAGRVADLKALVDGFDGADTKPPQALLDLVGTLPGHAQVWAASLRPAAMVRPDGAAGDSRLEGNLLGNLVRAGQRVTNFKMWGELSQSLELHVQATAANQTEAGTLRDTFKAAVAMARLQTRPEQSAMLKFYDGLSTTTDGSILHIEARESFELMDALLWQLPRGTMPLGHGQ
jgi:hypothetical protein